MTHQNDLSAGTIEEVLRNGWEEVTEMVRVLLSSVVPAESKSFRQEKTNARKMGKVMPTGKKPKTHNLRQLINIDWIIPYRFLLLVF